MYLALVLMLCVVLSKSHVPAVELKKCLYCHTGFFDTNDGLAAYRTAFPNPTGWLKPGSTVQTSHNCMNAINVTTSIECRSECVTVRRTAAKPVLPLKRIINKKSCQPVVGTETMDVLRTCLSLVYPDTKDARRWVETNMQDILDCHNMRQIRIQHCNTHLCNDEVDADKSSGARWIGTSWSTVVLAVTLFTSIVIQ